MFHDNIQLSLLCQRVHNNAGCQQAVNIPILINYGIIQLYLACFYVHTEGKASHDHKKLFTKRCFLTVMFSTFFHEIKVFLKTFYDASM